MISSASSGDWFDLRQFLGFEREYPHLGHLSLPLQANTGSLITSLSARNKSLLSNLLLAYRMVDIAATLECHPELPLRYEKTGDFGRSIQVGKFSLLAIHHLLILHNHDTLQLFDRLQKWPSLLSTFIAAIHSPFAIIVTNPNSPEESPHSRHIAVLKNLMDCRGGVAGLINVQLAVISLHGMLTSVSAVMPIGLAHPPTNQEP